MRHLIALITVSTVLALAGAAKASPVQITFGANGLTSTVVDGGAGDADGVVNNSINVASMVVGGYSFNMTFTNSNSPGGGVVAFVDNSTTTISDVGGGATTISILVSANDFTFPVGGANVFSGGTAQFKSQTRFGNTAAVSLSTYIDTTNAVSSVPTGALVGFDSAMIAQPGSASTNLMDSTSFNLTAAPYTLNWYLEAVLSAPGSHLDLDGQLLVAVPEPSSLALVTIGGLGLLIASRRRRRK